MFDFSSRENIKDFIHNTESGIYTGKNIDGENVVVIIEQGKGMDIKTQKHSKPKWYEVIEYDEDGFQVSVSYESVN